MEVEVVLVEGSESKCPAREQMWSHCTETPLLPPPSGDGVNDPPGLRREEAAEAWLGAGWGRGGEGGGNEGG